MSDERSLEVRYLMDLERKINETRMFAAFTFIGVAALIVMLVMRSG